MEYLWIALAALAVLIVIWYIAVYNRFVRLKVRIEEAFSTIDVYLKKRYDLIPNLVETVKGYASHEKETFERVVEARAKAHESSNVDEKIRNEGELTKALGRLMVLAENYPELKADSQFLNLQTQLSGIEGEISQSRKYYNGVVKSFNTLIITFPSMLVAKMSGFVKAEFFTVEQEEQRENVKVSFNE